MITTAISKEKIRIACAGDSITFGSRVNPVITASYPAQLGELLGCDYEVKNFGFPGANIADRGDVPYSKQEQFKMIKEYHPNIVIVMLGANDSKPQNVKYANDIEIDYKALINEFYIHDNHCEIYLIKPVPILENGSFGNDNQRLITEVIPRIEHVAKDMGLPLIDMYKAFIERSDIMSLYNKDNVHPNIFGARLLAQNVYKVLTNKKIQRVAIIGDNIVQGDPADVASFRNQLSYQLGVTYNVRSFCRSGSAVTADSDPMALFSYKKLNDFQQAQDFSPDVVIIVLGTNDTKPENYVFIEKFEDEYKLLVRTFTQAEIQSRVILATPIPVLNKGDYPVIDNERLTTGIIPKIQRISEAMQLQLIDFYGIFMKRQDIALLYRKDDVHPNSLGIFLMVTIIIDALLENQGGGS